MFLTITSKGLRQLQDLWSYVGPMDLSESSVKELQKNILELEILEPLEVGVLSLEDLQSEVEDHLLDPERFRPAVRAMFEAGYIMEAKDGG